MDQSVVQLKTILGDACFNSLTSQGTGDESELTNSKEIYCDCKTLVLRPNHARLVSPTSRMSEVEKELKFFQQGDKLFEKVKRGCYWLVDDMYKFEQIGYTKEINSQNLKRPTSTSDESTSGVSNEQSDVDNQQKRETSSALNGLRYLVCAECNLCPLGWFDPKTKESYLHVWHD